MTEQEEQALFLSPTLAGRCVISIRKILGAMHCKLEMHSGYVIKVSPLTCENVYFMDTLRTTSNC